MDRAGRNAILESGLVEEVIRELNKKLETGKKNCLLRRALVIGTLSQAEELALSSVYVPTEFTPQRSGDFDILVAARLSVKAMAALSQGIFFDEETACILESLLEGKKVYVLEQGMEYLRYRETAHKTLYHLFQEFEDRLKSFGVQVVRDALDIRKQEDVGTACMEEFSANGRDSGCLDLGGQKLLRESDVGRIRGTGLSAILLDRDAIVTPLAMDYITNHNLEIRRK